MSPEHSAIAALAATMAGLIAVTHPSLIPAMSIALIVWAALSLYLKP
ncbi:hypothetical protein [Streptomyces atratus]|nr:hypothetical protein [Streptomyces atratus]MCX5342660.1 hypothetical protein [Streptomyces atratus]